MASIASLSSRCSGVIQTVRRDLRDDTCRGAVDKLARRFQSWTISLGVFATGRRSLDTRVSLDAGLKDFISRQISRLEQEFEEILHPLTPEDSDSSPSDSDSDSSTSSGDSPNTNTDDPIVRANEILEHLFAVPSMIHLEPSILEPGCVLDFSANTNIDCSALDFRVQNYLDKACPAMPKFLYERLVSTSRYRKSRILYLRNEQEKAMPDNQHPTERGDLTSPIEASISALTIALEDPLSLMLAEPLEKEQEAPQRWNDLNIPKPPSSPSMGDPPLCPYCSEVLSPEEVRGNKWKCHIIRDLQPYVCLFEDCPDGNVLYESSSAWVHHMRWKHCAFWYCPCQGHHQFMFKTLDQLEKHILVDHGDRSLLMLAANSHRLHPDPFWCLNMSLGRPDCNPTLCPLCTWTIGHGTITMMDHVLQHLESVSLLAAQEFKTGHADNRQ